jgi:2-polyprenyl-6-methoxyphenol hydroxylase-like FAD-dependent oxidoreductase
MTTDVDVLIVGSGPAGCSTALHLAKFAPALAQRCVVLEKSSHPRHKLCGGGLVVDVDTILHNLGLDLNDVPHVDATWAHLNFHGRGTRTRPHGDIAFHVVRRREFDHWLADRVRDTGVPIHEHTEVLALDRRPDHVVVETSRGTFRARAVIGADGTKGMVRRKITGDSGAMARLLEVMIPPPAQRRRPARRGRVRLPPHPARRPGLLLELPDGDRGPRDAKPRHLRQPRGRRRPAVRLAQALPRAGARRPGRGPRRLQARGPPHPPLLAAQRAVRPPHPARRRRRRRRPAARRGHQPRPRLRRTRGPRPHRRVRQRRPRVRTTTPAASTAARSAARSAAACSPPASSTA